MGLHAHTITKQGAACQGRGGVDSQQRNLAGLGEDFPQQGVDQGRLACPGCSGDADGIAAAGAHAETALYTRGVAAAALQDADQSGQGAPVTRQRTVKLPRQRLQRALHG